MLKKLLLAIVLFIIFPEKAMAATTYYVSTSGNDSSTGSSTSPFKTITQAFSIVSPGDTIKIKPGTYRENVNINSISGTNSSPIYVVGDTTNVNDYPTIDGGDANFSGSGNPAFFVDNSNWISFERLKIINSSEASYYIYNSHYITIRRNVIISNKIGIHLKGNTSHVLAEYNNISQNLPSNYTWTNLKGSKYEGAGFWGSAAGMHIIRNNFFHDSVNAVVLLTSGSFNRKATNANVFIYKNRFENIIDDPYEPETYAFNNHFFQNTLINTHRMVSLVNNNLTGPVYVYNNMQIVTQDPTREATSLGRANSAVKLGLAGTNENGAYFFNNSIELSSPSVNGYGVDFLSNTVNKFYHWNNVYKTFRSPLRSSITLNNSSFDNDMSHIALGYSELNGFSNVDPGFTNIQNEDLRPITGANMLGKSRSVNLPIGFANQNIINAGSSLGAFETSSTSFRNSPLPTYSTPPGGEDASFPQNVNWPADVHGGVNPINGPRWTGTNTTNPPVIVQKLGDVNNDNLVNIIDIGLLIDHYGQRPPANPRADINSDGVTNIIDIGIAIDNYGR